jgi:hypothetical protein
MAQLSQVLRQLGTEWEKSKDTEVYGLVQFGFKGGRSCVCHPEKTPVSREFCCIRCARYGGKSVVPMSDVLSFLPYLYGRERPAPL